MSMPQIPEGKNRPTFDETIIDLLESVALEEMALSHIMNAQGEKLQEMIKKFCCNKINFCDLEYSCKNMQGMMNSLIMKEWLLLTKLGTIMEVNCNVGRNEPQEKVCRTQQVKEERVSMNPYQYETCRSDIREAQVYTSRKCDIQYNYYPPSNQEYHSVKCHQYEHSNHCNPTHNNGNSYWK